MFFSNTRWTQLLVPLEILMSKISLKYIPIHIYNFEHSRGIINMKDRSKMAPQMAATVLCSSVFVLFLFVFPVFCFSNTISFTRDELLNIRQNTPQHLLPDFDY